MRQPWVTDAAGLSRRHLLGGAAVAGLAAVTVDAPPGRTHRWPLDRRRDVRVSHDGFAMHGEPSVAADPTDCRRLLAASQAWQPGDAVNQLVSYASFDGGSTWRSNGPLPLPPGTTNGDDVTVAFDERGTGVICAMARPDPWVTSRGRGVFVWRTTDGGRTFTDPVPVAFGDAVDHPALAVEPGAPGFVHVVWSTDGGLAYARSRDGGHSFEPPRDVVTGVGGVPSVAPGGGGSVHITFTGSDGSADPDRAGASGSQVSCTGDTLQDVVWVSSTDHGSSFGEPVTVGRIASRVSLPGPVVAISLPAVAATRDAAFIAFTTHQPGAAGTDLVVARARDRARGRFSLVTVTPPDDLIYFQPQLATDRQGRLAMTAFRLGSGGVDTLIWISTTDGRLPRDPVALTERPFDPALAPHRPVTCKTGSWWIGDYQGLAASPGGFHPVWNDTRTGRLDLFTTTVR